MRGNAIAFKHQISLEKQQKAQELCDEGYSNERIAAEIEVSRHTIEKWIKLGIVKTKVDLYNKKKKTKMLVAQKLLNNKVHINKIARKISVHTTTVSRWKKEGKIK